MEKTTINKLSLLLTILLSAYSIQSLCMKKIETSQAFNTECPICKDEESPAELKLDCGHAYHRTCIYPWFNQQKNNACPLCKQNDLKTGKITNEGQFHIQEKREFNLFDKKTGESINKTPIRPNPYKTIISKNIKGKICIIEYHNNTFDLFNITTAQQVNQNIIQANQNKTITGWGIRNNNNILCVGYQDNTIDLFNITTAQQINLNTIQPNQNKTITGWDIRNNNNNILCVGYQDNTIDLFNIITGKKVDNPRKRERNRENDPLLKETLRQAQDDRRPTKKRKLE